MKYDGKENMYIEPNEWDRNSSKEILQYALGSLMYTPGTYDKLAKDIKEGKRKELRASALCLEDSIGDSVVDVAEDTVVETLRQLMDVDVKETPLMFIRVRELGQMTRMVEKLGDAVSVLSGFILPKFDSKNCNQYVLEFENLLQDNPRLYIMPILESKRVMYKQLRLKELRDIDRSLHKIADNVLNIRVGSADFCSIFGVRRKPIQNIYDVGVVADCLTDIVNMFGQNYICSGPVWEYYDTEGKEGIWSQGLQRELELDRLHGFLGKTCIHPSQLVHIQESLRVNYEDYQDAISILGIPEGVIGVKNGYGKNKMNEVKTHTIWAQKIVGLAYVYGVKGE